MYDRARESFQQSLRVVVLAFMFQKYSVELHVSMGHADWSSVATRVMQMMYCKKFKRLVRRAIFQCVPCKLSDNAVERAPAIGPIILPARVFDEIGVDLYGPLRRPNLTILNSGLPLHRRLVIMSSLLCLICTSLKWSIREVGILFSCLSLTGSWLWCYGN